VAERQIDRGLAADGVRWTLKAGGDDENYGTTLRTEDDAGVIASGGMAGPKLWGAALLNVSTGGNPNRGPKSVIIRSDPLISRLLLVLEDGTSADVTACGGEVVDGLRFGVSILSAETPMREVVGLARDGTVVERFDLADHDSPWRRHR
jgi:hypothetical protein